MSLTQTLAGESFQAGIHLSNNSAVPVHNVVMRIELSINTVKTTLFHNSSGEEANTTIEPGSSFDTNVERTLGKEGLYVIACDVS